MSHTWIANTLLDIASYAEKHGLHKLHLDLCAAMVTALQSVDAHKSQVMEQASIDPSYSSSNVLKMADFRTAQS